MLAIRLTRKGAKKQPFYRVVVTEKESKRDGRFVEILGHYDPIQTPAIIKLDTERINYWIGRGAQPTETVKKLLKNQTPVEQPAEQ
ncbi:MAG TPA: 30S ribosomal protein S16 [Blastocatellia bacterium]|nr:30S ribosomal protein S16 [Blastocatellia bacterium]